MSDAQHYSIIAIAGPQREIAGLKEKLPEFSEVRVFDVPDDYGEFPDTSGYVKEDWESVVLHKEDGSLYSYMTKCMDCVLEFTNKRAVTMDSLGYMDIAATVHWPRFGGSVFAVTGHITGRAPNWQIRPKMSN